jgi:glutathione S-transferase
MSSRHQGGPRVHPCRRAQEALREATGDVKLPTLVLADGTVIAHSKAILRWISQQR